MIVSCEKCESKFRLDEAHIKREGSKVRCSLCSHVFTVFPPEKGLAEGVLTSEDLDRAFRETVELDSPPRGQGTHEPLSGDSPPEGPSLDQAETDALEKDFESLLSDESEGGEDVRELGRGRAEVEPAPDAAPEPQPAESFDEEGETIAPPDMAMEERGRSRALLFICIIIFVLLAGGAGVYFFAPHLLPGFAQKSEAPLVKENAEKGISRLKFPTVSGSFVTSEKAGQLFVIRGMVTNDFSRARSHIFIKGALLDDRGDVVMEKRAYAGNSLSDEEFQSMGMDAIDQALQNKAGKQNMNVDVQPGKSIPIMIVFGDLPENLSEFTVEPVSSDQGT